MSRRKPSARYREQCNGKRPYADEAEAWACVAEMHLNPDVRDPDWLDIYVCRFCGSWHVGHSPRPNPRLLLDCRVTPALRYETHPEAWAEAVEAFMLAGSLMTCFQCPHCDGWHVTRGSAPSKTAKARLSKAARRRLRKEAVNA